MLTPLILLIFYTCEVILTGEHNRVEEDCYKIPQPKIEAFVPRGFRASIDDSPGIRFFAFHANINKQLASLDAGMYLKESRQSKNGRWIVEDKQPRLHVGDKICYWMFVIKNNLGYRLDGQCYVIEELLPSPFVSNLPFNTELPYFADNLTYPPQRRTSTETTTVSSDVLKNTLLCEETILKTTEALISLRSETEKLKKINKLLLNGLDQYPGSRQMKLSGRVPPNGTALAVLETILKEKLDLKPQILWAMRESTGSIAFEVPSVLDKFEILLVAKEKLRTNKFEFN